MNRLILIGNGFDLAHGMETSYTDFIKWHLKTRILGILNGGKQSDRLTKITRTDDYLGIINDKLIDIWVNSCFNTGLNLNKFGEATQHHFTQNIIYPFKFTIESKLLESLIKRCSSHRWVDIEAIFYEQMLSILDSKAGDVDKENALLELNTSMGIIILALQQYLSSIESGKKIEEYVKIMFGDIEAKDVQSKSVKIRNPYNHSFQTSEPKETLILNFNYTSTCTLYNESVANKSIRTMFIHGELNNVKNPIIFGFGDEVDRRYAEMENSLVPGWFDYIKSFWYLKTNNYRDLASFIDSDEYQVLVLGHSCGLSDRTMLQMIFQHDNCRSIKLYYKEDQQCRVLNNHRQTLHEIARHFKDKGLMRRRIVSEENSSRMPQHNDKT